MPSRIPLSGSHRQPSCIPLGPNHRRTNERLRAGADPGDSAVRAAATAIGPYLPGHVVHPGRRRGADRHRRGFGQQRLPADDDRRHARHLRAREPGARRIGGQGERSLLPRSQDHDQSVPCRVAKGGGDLRPAGRDRNHRRGEGLAARNAEGLGDSGRAVSRWKRASGAGRPRHGDDRRFGVESSTSSHGPDRECGGGGDRGGRGRGAGGKPSRGGRDSAGTEVCRRGVSCARGTARSAERG